MKDSKYYIPKQYLLVLLFSLGSFHSSVAFSKPILRHIHGFYGVEARVGLFFKGICGVIDGSYYLTRTLQFKGGLGVAVESKKNYCIYTQPSLAYTLYDLSDRGYVNMIGGAILAYKTTQEDTIHNTTKITRSFNFGTFIGLEMEYFLLPHIAIVAQVSPRLYFLGEEGLKWNFTVEGGLKYVF